MSIGWNFATSDTEIPTPWVAWKTWWVDVVLAEIKVWSGTEWIVKAPGADTPALQSVYIMAPYNLGTVPADRKMLIHPVGEPFTIPSGGGNSIAYGDVAATGTTTFSLRKNNVEFGTMQWAAAANLATFTIASDTSFSRASQDRFSIIAPNTPDATLADVGITIHGVRS